MSNTYSDIFEYADGKLLWKIRRARRVKVGAEAGSLHEGYVRLHLTGMGGRMFAHNVVWEMFNGPIPEEMVVDHINGIKSDNRIENLRLVTRSQNAMNAKIRSHNTSGVKNVSWYPSSQRWVVKVCVGGSQKHLGYFKDLELAELVAQEARAKYHGEYAREF
jgi:hypothetical protein